MSMATPIASDAMSVSVVVPICNELENIPLLYQQLAAVLPSLARPWEIVFVDDGSTDGSSERLKELAARDARVKVVRFRRNYGQTAAMQAGIQHSTGDVIVTLDGDLQNDPLDIPDAGQQARRRLRPGSRLAEAAARHAAHAQDSVADRQLADLATSPAFRFTTWAARSRRSAARSPSSWSCTARCTASFRSWPISAGRGASKSSRGIIRGDLARRNTACRGPCACVLDLITVKYMLDYFASPMKLFGRFGLACLAVALAAGLATVGMKLAGGTDMTGNPLMLLAVLGTIAAIQFFSLGLLGEVNARIYYGSQPRQNYAIRELVNCDDDVGSRAIASRAA